MLLKVVVSKKANAGIKMSGQLERACAQVLLVFIVTWQSISTDVSHEQTPRVLIDAVEHLDYVCSFLRFLEHV
jgi:hypothetical protein